MARYKGTFQNPANYEPLIAAPFDARELVDTKADLIAASTWQQKNGDLWVYEGMKVSVKEDHTIYILKNPISYFLESSWVRLATWEEIESINQKIGELPEGKTVIDLINEIEGGNGFYDDTELVNRIEVVETEQNTLKSDFEALKSLVGDTSVNNQITLAVDALAPIAKTGNINDLTQTQGEYVILTCGTSGELD